MANLNSSYRDSSPQIPSDSANVAYEEWSIQMQNFFVSEGLWDVVQNGYELPKDAAELASWDDKKRVQFDENQSKDATALQYIKEGVSRRLFSIIKAASTAKIAWEMLMNEFKGLDMSKHFGKNKAQEEEHLNGKNATEDKEHLNGTKDQDDEYYNWITRIKYDLAGSTSIPSSFCICSIPSKLRNVKNDAYSPQIISIGPLHHGMEQLLAMEEYKSYYTFALLLETRNPFKILDECGKAILQFDKRVRNCYLEQIRYDKYELARMLILDGCFILELFLRVFEPDSANQDPLFTTSWMISAIRRDLSLLENQIPFFVLSELYKTIVEGERRDTAPLLKLALYFFKPKLVINERTLHDGCHLLDILHKSYLPFSHRKNPEDQGAWKLVLCAESLRDVGIEFRKESTANLFDLTFENGVFKIPPLNVNDATDSLLRNLIAFEQFFPSHGQHVTSCVTHGSTDKYNRGRGIAREKPDY